VFLEFQLGVTIPEDRPSGPRNVDFTCIVEPEESVAIRTRQSGPGSAVE
jgi:hypothetical protein